MSWGILKQRKWVFSLEKSPLRNLYVLFVCGVRVCVLQGRSCSGREVDPRPLPMHS